MTLLVILWLAASPASAGTPCPKKVEDRKTPCTASTKEQEKIMKLINRGVAAYDKYETDKVDETNLREEIRLLESRGVEPSFKLRDKWFKANSGIEINKARMQSDLNEAAALTSLYYGLGHKSRDIANGPLERREARWKPQFVYAAIGQGGDYESVYRKLSLQPENQAHHLELNFGKVDDGVQAFTLEDGSVNISIEAFKLARDKGSPRLLAKTIYHEGIHFDDLVKGGWKESREALEPDAYGRTFKAAHIFELTAAEKAAVQAQWTNASVKRVQVDVGMEKPTPSFSTPEQRRKVGKDFEGRMEADSAAEGERRTLEEGFEAAREAMERSGRERRAEEERRKFEEEGRRKDEAGARDLLYIKDLAAWACVMGSLDQPTLAKFIPSADPPFYCDRAPKTVSADDSCSERIFGRILGQLCRKEAISAALINEIVEKYRPRPGAGATPCPPQEGRRSPSRPQSRRRQAGIWPAWRSRRAPIPAA